MLCFKQKTAYELRISDWSSDVCSSDLAVSRALRVHFAQRALPGAGGEAEIQEAGAGDLDRGDVVVGRQRVDQRLRQRARVRSRRPGQQHRGVGREVAVAAVLRPLDDEVGRGEVGGQGSGGAEGIDALCDQGAELGFHGDVVSRFNGPALYVSATKGRVGGRRWHILVPHVRVLSSVNQKVAARGFGSSHPDPAAQTKPRAASETGAPSPITKWSSRRTSPSPH